MIYNLLIGGAAGLGMETTAAILAKILKRNGLEIFVIQDYMSRVRGGHNFFQIRFADEKIESHGDQLDVIIALDGETVATHLGRLKGDGFIIADQAISSDDSRFRGLPLAAAAKEIGNLRVAATVALGAVLKIFQLELTGAEEVFLEKFPEEVARQNIAALAAGYQLTAGSYAPLTPQKGEKILVNGTDGIALGALAAGVKFYSAYPMTPSTGIMNFLAGRMNQAEVVVEQAEDEIAAINMAIGASFAGARAMTATSGGGFALMVEAVGLTAMLEVPLVIVEMQRPGPATGFPTRTEQGDLKFVIYSSPSEIPKMVIALRDPADAFYQTVRAFDLADRYQLPVILMGDQFLADSTRTVDPFDFGRIKNDQHLSRETYTEATPYRRYEVTESGISPRIIPGQVPGQLVLVDSDEHDEAGRITESDEVRVRMHSKRLRKMTSLQADLQEPDYFGADQAETLFLAWGSLASPVREAVRLLNAADGELYGALLFGDVWPLPEQRLREKAAQAKRIVNVEQNATGQFASLVRERTGIVCGSSILKYDGRPLSAEEIVSQIQGGEIG